MVEGGKCDGQRVQGVAVALTGRCASLRLTTDALFCLYPEPFSSLCPPFCSRRSVPASAESQPGRWPCQPIVSVAAAPAELLSCRAGLDRQSACAPCGTQTSLSNLGSSQSNSVSVPTCCAQEFLFYHAVRFPSILPW
jgi:hypothetical protein